VVVHLRPVYVEERPYKEEYAEEYRIEEPPRVFKEARHYQRHRAITARGGVELCKVPIA
jgi:hypothetical protein